jgi:beta-lactamase class A
MLFRSKSDYDSYQNKLGNDARLGISFCLLDSNNKVIKQDGFNNNLKMPMASTMKVAIALLVLKKVFDEENLRLDDKVKIVNSDFSPGPPWNTLDRNFFIPWEVEETKMVDDLLTIMLRESDNTATDKLLGLIGGPQAVNDLMSNMGLDGYCLASTTKKLLSDYYGFDSEKSFYNILSVCWEFLSAFKMRPTEKSIFTNDHDVCTPEFMVNLVSMLVRESKKNESSWLSKAAKLICSKMEQCGTGIDLIRNGASNYSSHIKTIGDKTGSIGGVINDTAFIQFDNDQWMILSIYTCLSPLERSARSAVIADLTQDILTRNLDYQLQKNREKRSTLVT